MTRSVQCFVTCFVILFQIPLFANHSAKEGQPKNGRTFVSQIASGISISDRLVENLSCEKLSFQNFKRSIRKTFTSSIYHLPIQNYAIPFLGSEIANCWSLSRLQRLFFYLGTDDSLAKPNDVTFLNLIRGSEPYVSDSQLREWPQIKYPIFWWPTEIEQKAELLNEWMQIFHHDLGDSIRLNRNFKYELESFQRRRFGDFIRNAKYIVRSGARSPRVNRRTLQQLTAILDRNEIPLVIIRENRLAQHVVAIKDYKIEKDSRNVERFTFTVYDSNSPWTNNDFIFSTATDHFYAPKIMTGLTGVKNPHATMGVFLVDENERGYVLNSLFKNYQNKCTKLKSTAIN